MGGIQAWDRYSKGKKCPIRGNRSKGFVAVMSNDSFAIREV
jgi:hypothetical protein